MNILLPYFEILTEINYEKMLHALEAAGRTCYKSDPSASLEEAEKFIYAIIKRGHESVLEHQSISVRVVCDRGVSHELVRHRLASYSQESTRYCNYGGGDISFIKPVFLKDCPIGQVDRTFPFYQLTRSTILWLQLMIIAEQCYKDLLKEGLKPQEARAVLPNSLKTEIVMTMNLREWRHFFNLRARGTTGAPHPQMVEIAGPMLVKFAELMPCLFNP